MHVGATRHGGSREGPPWHPAPTLPLEDPAPSPALEEHGGAPLLWLPTIHLIQTDLACVCYIFVFCTVS